MSLISDKIGVSISSIDASVTLDASGTILVTSLAGSGTRLVTTDASGVFVGSALPSSDPSGLVGLFGDGRNGNVLITKNTTMTKELCCRNLTIAAYMTLDTSGYIIRVLGTLTVQFGGIISSDGRVGTNASPWVAGVGGAAAFLTANYDWQTEPSAGGNGAITTSNSTSNSIGAGGGLSALTVTGSPTQYRSGAGGGGGGAHGVTSTAAQTGGGVWVGNRGGTGRTATGTGSTQRRGGGGGGGGGSVVIYAHTINNAGTIRANGGNGGNGYSATDSGGGGGGGGGGHVVIHYRETTGSGLGIRHANGGTVGSNGTGGTNGDAGVVATYRM